MALTFYSGMKLTPARLNALIPLEAVKPGSTSRLSTITPTDDPDLFLPVEANAAYDLTGVWASTGGAGDILFDWTYPTGALLTWTGPGPHNSLSSGSNVVGEWQWDFLNPAPSSITIPYGISASGAAGLFNGRLLMGTVAGTLQLRWAQNSSNTTPTVLQAGSYIRLRRTA